VTDQASSYCHESSNLAIFPGCPEPPSVAVKACGLDGATSSGFFLLNSSVWSQLRAEAALIASITVDYALARAKTPCKDHGAVWFEILAQDPFRSARTPILVTSLPSKWGGRITTDVSCLSLSRGPARGAEILISTAPTGNSPLLTNRQMVEEKENEHLSCSRTAYNFRQYHGGQTGAPPAADIMLRLGRGGRGDKHSSLPRCSVNNLRRLWTRQCKGRLMVYCQGIICRQACW
jgi:hypothetical protein